MQDFDLSNNKFKLAESFINQTGCNVYLTGKAGTGKTTFLRYIKNNTYKKSVVVAPTGVAAINSGGVTIHSFFQLPLGIYSPELLSNQFYESGKRVYDRNYLYRNLRINSNKIKLFQELELLIIDEVSMLRADMLDAIDAVLRKYRKRRYELFGGVQVLLIGDLYQLPPVVKEENKEIIFSNYRSPFFFDAHVLQEKPPVCIEFSKIYRQNDKTFIDLLNRIRKNEITNHDIALLNKYYNPDFKTDPEDNLITLTTHNTKARQINQKALNELPGQLYTFEAEIEGDFNENAFPADKSLQLKEGAQIMFIRNDNKEIPDYYNGKIGKIDSIDDDGIKVKFSDKDTPIIIEKESWENINYAYNEEKQSIEQKKQGVFKQYPIRLAWAVTIHKSQGLTFEKAIIDAGNSFSSGQVYVALSRLTSIEGLILHSSLKANNIYCDDEVIHFMEKNTLEDAKMEHMLKQEQKKFIFDLLCNIFSWHNLINNIEEIINEYKEKAVDYQSLVLENARIWHQKAEEQKEIGDKFIKKIEQLRDKGESSYSILYERVNAAVEYFDNRLSEEIMNPLQQHYEEFKKKKNIKKYLKKLASLESLIYQKQKQLNQAKLLVDGLWKGTNHSDLLQEFKNQKNEENRSKEKYQKSKKPAKGQSPQITLEMYKEGKSIEEIKNERSLAKSTIEGHLLKFIKTGDLSVYDYVSKEKIENILKQIQKSDNLKATPIREILGENYSYNEIRAVINHFMYSENILQ